jgi:hypothetical protein
MEMAETFLYDCFVVISLIALKLSKSKELIPQTTAWYHKQDVTFTDVLAYVRRHIWEGKYNKPINSSGYALFQWESLLDQLATVA